MFEIIKKWLFTPQDFIVILGNNDIFMKDFVHDYMKVDVCSYGGKPVIFNIDNKKVVYYPYKDFSIKDISLIDEVFLQTKKTYNNKICIIVMSTNKMHLNKKEFIKLLDKYECFVVCKEFNNWKIVPDDEILNCF